MSPEEKEAALARNPEARAAADKEIAEQVQRKADLEKLNADIEARNKKFWEDYHRKAEEQRKETEERAQSALDKILSAPQKPPAPVELATAEEIAVAVRESGIDLTADHDPGERAYNLTVAQIQRDATEGPRKVLARMAKEFSEVDPHVFVPKSFHEAHLFIDQIAYQLHQLAIAKVSEIMAPYVAGIQRMYAAIAVALEKSADAKTEAASQAHKIAESGRESAERSEFERGARARFLRGHDGHVFRFVGKPFVAPALSQRLVATAKALRAEKYIPRYGNRPSEAPLHGRLALALTSHPGK